MGLFNRFFGRRQTEDGNKPTANPAVERGLSLQVLLASPSLNVEAFETALHEYHPALSKACVEIDPALAAKGTPIGLVSFSRHVVQLVGFDVSMPAAVVEQCVGPSHYRQEDKAVARASKGHIILYYAGEEEDVLEQYVALAAVAAAICEAGGQTVLNESAYTSTLPELIRKREIGDLDALEYLRAFPLLMLYCGFVKYEVPGIEGVWMRTYGCPLLGLPNLAMLTAGHHEGQRTFDLFTNVLAYLRDSGAVLGPGHTMQAGEDVYLKVRAPNAQEDFLNDSTGELLVAELISESEINRRRA